MFFFLKKKSKYHNFKKLEKNRPYKFKKKTKIYHYQRGRNNNIPCM